MTSNSIAIRNIYVMMAYAFRTVRSDGVDQFDGESFDHLHDLFAEMLAVGVGSQIKRGLHRDYVLQSDTLTTVRGRIDVAGTVASRAAGHGRLLCEFDEYTSDTPHNRALKSVIILLIRHGQVDPPRRTALRRLLPYLESVTLIAPTSIRWNMLTYHRANANYRLLLGACELIVRGLLPKREEGTVKLASWITDDEMSSLYERFLREYYVFHHPDLSPGARNVSWAYDTASAIGANYLPAMRTDVTLKRRQRTLIIDAKFYKKSMQVSMWGKKTIYSSHLYQLLTYVNNADIDRDGSVSGLLLYARTESQEIPDLDIVVQGSRIGARTLDLNRPWPHLRNQLETATQWLDS